MGKKHKISDDCWTDGSFELYAIHTHMEEYALAYALNEVLNARLVRCGCDLEIAQNAAFPVFEWDDEINYRSWLLFKNKDVRESELEDSNLFSSLISVTRSYLIPEKKEVDYFLKVSSESQEKSLLASLLGVPRIMTAYELETQKLRSLSNLIF